MDCVTTFVTVHSYVFLPSQKDDSFLTLFLFFLFNQITHFIYI
ncbi:hypothetical protein HMPREF0352_2114 [Enterococcus faecium TX1330]|nr:hypothetical protein HMPREF0352_2114 [Enterococcus faecium TX1330]